MRPILIAMLVAVTAGCTATAPWQMSEAQTPLERELLNAAHSPGETLCVPVAEKIRAETGATIYAVQGQHGESHAIACKLGVCADNGLLSTGKYGSRRAFLFSALDRYYTVMGKWACRDGVAHCAVNGVEHHAVRANKSG